MAGHIISGRASDDGRGVFLGALRRDNVLEYAVTKLHFLSAYESMNMTLRNFGKH